jgi:hypothetical protein
MVIRVPARLSLTLEYIPRSTLFSPRLAVEGWDTARNVEELAFERSLEEQHTGQRTGHKARQRKKHRPLSRFGYQISLLCP